MNKNTIPKEIINSKEGGVRYVAKKETIYLTRFFYKSSPMYLPFPPIQPHNLHHLPICVFPIAPNNNTS